MITKANLRTDLPPAIKDHIVLALAADCYYASNGCNAHWRWQIVNAVYYNKYPHQYQGWIELEQIPQPETIVKLFQPLNLKTNEKIV